MKKIAIMVDSGCDITRDEANELDVYVARMIVTVDGKEYLEDVDINASEIADKMRNGAVVKTSQPNLGETIKMWKEILKTHDQIIYIPISSGLSGTYQTSYLASKDFPNQVYVIDAKFACAPTKVLIKYVKEMIEKDYSCEQIVDKIEKEAEMFAIIVPEKLEYLKRGGRISAAAAALGSLLKIVPILKVENGAIDVETKVRTTSKAYQVAMETCLNVENVDDYEWMMLSCDNDIEEYRKQYEEKIGRPVLSDSIKAIIMAHTGPGTFACGRIKKIKI